MNWDEIAAGNLLPLSKEQVNLELALEEWYHAGQVEDYGKPNQICQLCGKEKLRYHFQIQNEHTGNTLWVGSTCILKFDIKVYDETGQLVETRQARQRQLQAKVRSLRKKACLVAKIESQRPPVLERPLRFDPRAHKYTLTFYDQAGEPLRRLFRGDLSFCKDFISAEIKKYPEGTKAEVLVTMTGEVVYQYGF